MSAGKLPLLPDETYYLQGVTPSVRKRDVAVVMEYDVTQHAGLALSFPCGRPFSAVSALNEFRRAVRPRR